MTKKHAVALAVLALAFLAFCTLWAHAQQNKTNMQSEITTNLPDNVTGLITPAITRTTLGDIVKSYQQASTVRNVTAGSDTIATTDFGNLIIYNNASGVAVSIAQATGSFANFNVFVKNIGLGSATITPTTSTINGVASLVVPQNALSWIVSDGANYQIWSLPIAVGSNWPACTGNNSAVDSTVAGVLTCNSNLVNLTSTSQQITGAAFTTPVIDTSGNITLNCGGVGALQYIVNTGAFTITAPTPSTTDGQNCALRVVNGTTAANAGAVTLSGFSGKSPGGATFSTTPTISAASISFSNGSANITWTQSLPLGTPVFFATTGSLPTNFATATLYYVVTTGATQIQVATTPGGTAVVAGSAGSGTQTGYEPSVFDLITLANYGPVYAQWNQVQ